MQKLLMANSGGMEEGLNEPSIFCDLVAFKRQHKLQSHLLKCNSTFKTEYLFIYYDLRIFGVTNDPDKSK